MACSSTGSSFVVCVRATFLHIDLCMSICGSFLLLTICCMFDILVCYHLPLVISEHIICATLLTDQILLSTTSSSIGTAVWLHLDH